MREFAVYKGDELLVMGTANECAEALGVTSDYIRWLVTPAAARRFKERKNPDRCIVGIRLDTEDDENE